LRNRTGRRRQLLAVIATVGAFLAGMPGLPARATPLPSVRLFAADHDIEVIRYGQRFPLQSLGTWVGSSGGAFELHASRPDYDTPVGIVQTDPQTEAVVRQLPADALDGWNGLAGFLRIKVSTASGRELFSDARTFCPNSWNASRVDDGGPAESRYPTYCGGMPLTRGTVWGIDAGWAVPGFGFEGGPRSIPLEDGSYTFRVTIAKRYADLFEVQAADRVVTIHVSVETATGRSGGGELRPNREEAEPTSVPDTTTPDPDTVPDLVALPAWGFSTDRRHGHDYLSFAATEWNSGPAPLIIEGFRRPEEAVMDAYQYFYRDGEAVGRAAVGTLEYHAGGGHDHWHLEFFTRYTLLDASLSETVVSGKQSWCLAPTDPIDLSVPGAVWNTEFHGFGSACGGQEAIWVRENLDAGWGDTYFQSYGGQAFEITDVPNGRYYVRVHVNPLGSLYEADPSNDVELRRIVLRGTPGHRRVIVPPWHGIDTESGYYGCC
jgi:hypothetical protein